MPECLPIHVSEVPEYEVRGDCMRVTWRGLELYVPIPIVYAAMHRCEVALREWEAREASVIQFPQAAE